MSATCSDLPGGCCARYTLTARNKDRRRWSPCAATLRRHPFHIGHTYETQKQAPAAYSRYWAGEFPRRRDVPDPPASLVPASDRTSPSGWARHSELVE